MKNNEIFKVDYSVGLKHRVNIPKHALQYTFNKKANNVKWILSDASHFTPSEKYDFWHDRAAFHFLTDEQEINDYLQIAHKNINPAGVFVLGTFSDKGPKKCSGIEIKQYSEETMNNMLTKYFNKVKCISVNHTTPSDTIQNFIFCSFKNKQ